MADQLRQRNGFTRPEQFETWARTQEGTAQQKAREEAEIQARIERAAREKAREEREEQERAVREARARHEEEVRRLVESGASPEVIAQAEEAAKKADTLDPKYERMLDKLIAQTQGFRKIKLLFEQVESAVDLLPHKKVEALRRNIRRA